MTPASGHFDHFIGGALVAGGDYTENRNPSDTDDLIGLYAVGGVEEVDAAVAAATQAFATWSTTPTGQRSAVLQRISAGIAEREPELADMLAREEGKTLAEAIGEVRRAAATFSYYAGEIMQATGSVYASLASPTTIETVHRPLGVVGIITPWNFPIAIPAWSRRSGPRLRQHGGAEARRAHPGHLLAVGRDHSFQRDPRWSIRTS